MSAKWPAGCPSTIREKDHELGKLERPGPADQSPGRTGKGRGGRPGQKDSSAGLAVHRGPDGGGGLRDVFGGAGAPARLERKEHEVRPLRLPAGGGGDRPGLWVLGMGGGGAGPAGAAAGGGLLPAAGLDHRGHPPGRLRRHLRRLSQLRRAGKAPGHPQGPPLRGLCGDPAVQLVRGRSGPVRRPAPDHPRGGLYAAGLCAGTGHFGLGGGRSASGQKHWPCPYFFHRGGPAAGQADPDRGHPGRLDAAGGVRRGVWLGHAGRGPGRFVAVRRGFPAGLRGHHRGPGRVVFAAV